MRVRATGDLHISVATERYVHEALDVMEADAREHQAAGIAQMDVIQGDVFDQVETVPTRVLLALRDRLAAWPCPVYVLAGNHDLVPGTQRSPLELLRDVAEVVSPHDEMPYRVTPWGVMVPWLGSRWAEVVAPVLAHIAEADALIVPGGRVARVIYTHAGFKGSYQNSNRRDHDGVPVSTVPSDWIVSTSHYHMPQTVGRVIYAGSPYECSFSEEGQRKGYLVWDDVTVNNRPTRLPFASSAPRHFTVHWEPGQVADIPAGADAARDIIRVVTVATKDEVAAAAPELRKAGLGAAAVLSAPSSTVGRGVVDPSAGPRAAVEAWVASVHGDAAPAMTQWAEERALWAD